MSTSDGSLADLVSDLCDLQPPLNVDPGRVLVTLRHGAPTGVARPGKKLRRGRGLPLTPSPQGVLVSTEDVPISCQIRDIHLRGDYDLMALTVRYVIAVSQSDNYAALIGYIARKGLNFASMLDGEVRNEIDKRVRSELGQYTARELLDRGNLTDLVAGGNNLLGGLFAVQSIQDASPTWDPEFMRARQVTATGATELAVKLTELSQRDVDLALQQARDDVLQAAAVRRGLSIAELEDPDLVKLRESQDHELRVEILRNLDGVRRGGGSELLRHAVLRVTEGGPELPTQRSADELTAAPPWSMDGLERNAALARLWRKAGLPGEPVGAAMSDRGDDVTVLVACIEPPGEEDRTRLVQAYRNAVDATEVILLAGATVEGLVLDYLVQRAPVLADSAATVKLSRNGETGVIELSSEEARLSTPLRVLNDPAQDHLSPLASLLDVQDVELRAR